MSKNKHHSRSLISPQISKGVIAGAGTLVAGLSLGAIVVLIFKLIKLKRQNRQRNGNNEAKSSSYLENNQRINTNEGVIENINDINTSSANNLGINEYEPSISESSLYTQGELTNNDNVIELTNITIPNNKKQRVLRNVRLDSKTGRNLRPSY